MRTTIERQAADLDAGRLHPSHLRSVLSAVLALHALEDPRRFPEVLLRELERLLPADHVDDDELRSSWADRSGKEHDSAGNLRAPARAPVKRR